MGLELISRLALIARLCLATSSAAVMTDCSNHDGSDAIVQNDTTTHVGISAHDWTRFGWNAGRSNASTDATGINAGNVATLQRQQVALDGTVDGSAIYLHGVEVNGALHDVFFVTTTYGKTLAIDANNGAILWHFTPPDYDSYAGSYRITTASPVADPDRQSIYAAAPNGNIMKLNVADGHAVWTTSITRLPAREKIAAALNFDRGHVIAVTGGYIGDEPPYQGHVAVIDAASGRLLHVWNSLCSDRAGLIDPGSCSESGAAIWGRGGAVIDTTTGNIYVATGDARWDGRTFWGDAVVELNADATQILGNYTPSNTEQLDESDADLGSTSPVLPGNNSVVQSGKDGRIRLLDFNALSAATPHAGHESDVVSTPSGNDLFSAPALWQTTNGTWLFAADRGGTTAWKIAGGKFQQVWHSDDGGTSPVVADGLLYVYDARNGMQVYDAETGRVITHLDCGSGHWNSPIIVDGRVALPEGNANSRKTTGVLDIFRLQ